MVEKVSNIYSSAFNHVSGRPQRNYRFLCVSFIYLEGFLKIII